jgi:hypothetical protein
MKNIKSDLQDVLFYVRSIGKAKDIKVHRGFTDFLADKIKQAATEKNLFAFFERLCVLLNTQVQFVEEAALKSFLNVPSAQKKIILRWLRQNNKLVAMIANMRNEADIKEAIEQIEIDESADGDYVLNISKFEIPIMIICLSPLAHGADMKAGNATLFRRMQVKSQNGNILSLPFYAGNAIRGEMRDLLADHFLKSLGIATRNAKAIKLWFFHTLYSGGCLEENSEQEKVLGKKLGNSGASKAQGIAEFRKMIVPCSVLGTALGNRVLSGRFNISDFRPVCKEWGSGTQDVDSFFEWLFLTRREDNEQHEAGDNSSMIANTEVLKIGVVLNGGIDIHGWANDLERSCLAMGLKLLKNHGFIGAENRRGFGKVDIVFPEQDASIYESFLEDNKDKILQYLQEIGAIIEPGEKEEIETEPPPLPPKKQRKEKAQESLFEEDEEE